MARTRRYKGLIVGALVVLVVGLAACGGSNEGPNQQPAQVPGAAKLDKLTITLEPPK